MLVDSVRPQRTGAKLQVNFDVCGLAENTPFTTDIVVRRIGQNRFSRLVSGGVRPMTENFLGVAGGPRWRRSRVIDISALPPARYSLDIAVTDDKKRRVEKSWQFDVEDKK